MHRRTPKLHDARRLSLVLVLGLHLGLAVGCAPPRDLVTSPETLVFTPAATERTLTLHNPGAEPLPLAAIRLDSASPDWGSFVLTDASLPARIPAEGSIDLHLSADVEHFVGERVHGQPPRYRRGHARLLFAAEAPRAVDLRFEPAPPHSAAIEAIKLALFAGIVGALAFFGRRRQRRAPWLLLTTILLLPWGPPICFGALGSGLGLAALEQCAAGYGGAPLTLAAPPGGLLWIVALLVGGALLEHAAALRGPAPATDLRVAGRRALADVALLLGIAPALLGGATLDLAAVVDHQLVDGWRILHQPLAALLCVAAIALRRPPGAPRRDEDLALSALVALLFLGGWALPAPLAAHSALTHAALVGVGVLTCAAKIASVFGGVTLLRRRLLARRREPGRWLAPLVLLAAAELVVVLIIDLIRA